MSDCMHGMEPAWFAAAWRRLHGRLDRPLDLAVPVRRIEFRHITETPDESET